MLQIGVKNCEKETVTEKNVASALGSGSLDVYATPAMARLMEYTAARSLDGLLEDGQTTVGISLNLKHTSATPVGCIVVCESELISIEGKKLCFQIDVKDDFGSIGSSVHERFIVDRQTFMQKAENKLSTNH